MNKKFLWLSILAVILSFIGGFLLANALNRSEIERLTAENTRLVKQGSRGPTSGTQSDLTDEEIRAKIAEAEKNPSDFAFQKGLGLGLYRYAALKQNTELLEEVRTLLERAHQLNPDDYQVLVAYANINYDLGQIKKDRDKNMTARELYRRALEKNENDIDVRIDYGLTFLLTESPDRTKSIAEFEKALETDPKNEKALVYITQAEAQEKNAEKAGQYLDRLKASNPKNERIGELEKLIAEANK